MNPALLLPLLMLAGVMVASVWLAVAARNQKRLQRRVETMVPPDTLVRPLRGRGPNLRMRRSGSTRFGTLARLMRVPVDLPQAHVIQPAWIIAVATAAAVLMIWLSHFLFSWAVAAIIGVVLWLVVVRGIFGWEMERYRAKLIRQMPDTIQLVVSATRAGLPVSEAFQAIGEEMVSPTREEFVRVVNEMTLGVPADEALLSLHRRTGVTEYAIFAVTIGVQARSGGRLAETIQNLADTVRERLTIAGRARALAGEAKISAIIMAILPVVAGGMLSLVRPGHLDPLFTDPRGTRMFVIGITTLLLGILTMRQLIRGATRD